MLDQELIAACIKNDKNAKKTFYETFYGKVAAITLRYGKNREQSLEILKKGFDHLFTHLNKFRPSTLESLESWVRKEIILFTVDHIRNIRSEYYVASTVRVSDVADKSFDLFLDNNITDFKNVDFDVLIRSLHQLVPSQRLVFNLHVVEEYDLPKIAGILEASEQTVKSNLEKARYNLQKNVDKNTKQLRNEQFV